MSHYKIYPTVIDTNKNGCISMTYFGRVFDRIANAKVYAI